MGTLSTILALKWLTDDACITEKGRPFQTGIVLGKNEYLYMHLLKMTGAKIYNHAIS